MAERLPSAVTAFLACKIGARYRRAVIIASRRGSAIGSLTDWEVLGKPASPEHWKPGRSAYELAQDWIEGDAASDVIALLSARTELSGIELLEGVAEKQTQFDGISRGPRNHDLLVRGRLPDGASITVGVEGKADEPFDVPLWRYRENALKRSSQTQALARTDALVRQFFGTSLAADKGEPPIICMGYQLLSALAGTLADAKNDGSPYAVVLIMEYITDLTDDAEHAHNGRVLENFLARLLGVEAERKPHPFGMDHGSAVNSRRRIVGCEKHRSQLRQACPASSQRDVTSPCLHRATWAENVEAIPLRFSDLIPRSSRDAERGQASSVDALMRAILPGLAMMVASASVRR